MDWAPLWAGDGLLSVQTTLERARQTRLASIQLRTHCRRERHDRIGRILCMASVVDDPTGKSQGGDTQALLDEIAHLHRAVESRDTIGQAKGILMERHRVTADEAFDALRVASQRLNVKVAELALQLTQTGEWPPPGIKASPDGAMPNGQRSSS